ncbi:TerB family tellurite resistance protein [bacterium]|nr:TerB family tellurite resistance protein [bacterium]
MVLGRILVGAAIGFLMKGPIGNILNSLLDDSDEKKEFTEKEERAVYHAYLVTLFVYIAKADGALSPIEIRIIRDFFQKKGLSTEEMIQIKEALKIASQQKNVDIDTILDQINQIFDYPTKLSILELCYHIASADRVISVSEENRLEYIAKKMRISEMDHIDLQYEYNKGFSKNKKESIEDELKRMKEEMKGGWKESTNSNQNRSQNSSEKNSNSNKKQETRKEPQKTPFEILGVSEKATKKEIREAYLKLVEKWHPDKYPDEKQRAKAEEKIKVINQAYQELKNLS